MIIFQKKYFDDLLWQHGSKPSCSVKQKFHFTRHIPGGDRCDDDNYVDDFDDDDHHHRIVVDDNHDAYLMISRKACLWLIKPGILYKVRRNAVALLYCFEIITTIIFFIIISFADLCI